MERDQLMSSIDNARNRMRAATGTNEEMLALFDGITVSMVALVDEMAGIKAALESKPPTT